MSHVRVSSTEGKKDRQPRRGEPFSVAHARPLSIESPSLCAERDKTARRGGKRTGFTFLRQKVETNIIVPEERSVLPQGKSGTL